MENPSAFSEERFLCAPELASAWQAERDACRAAFELDRGCRGVVSFAGALQGSSVVVDAQLEEAEFSDQALADATWLRYQIRLEAKSPYFEFRLRFTSVGGGVLDADASRDLGLRRTGADDPALALDDAVAHAALALTASGQRLESTAEAGSLQISSQSLVEESASFQMELDDGAIEGCFHAFTTSRFLRPLDDDGSE